MSNLLAQKIAIRKQFNLEDGDQKAEDLAIATYKGLGKTITTSDDDFVYERIKDRESLEKFLAATASWTNEQRKDFIATFSVGRINPKYAVDIIHNQYAEERVKWHQRNQEFRKASVHNEMVKFTPSKYEAVKEAALNEYSGFASKGKVPTLAPERKDEDQAPDTGAPSSSTDEPTAQPTLTKEQSLKVALGVEAQMYQEEMIAKRAARRAAEEQAQAAAQAAAQAEASSSTDQVEPAVQE